MIEASIENKEQNLIKYDKVSMVSRTRMLLPILCYDCWPKIKDTHDEDI
jgi:hypothetical protein